MDLDDVMAGINLLVQQMETKPDDLHEIHFKLREMLNELKATGMPLPADLVALDEQLTVAESGSRSDEPPAT